MSSVRTETSFFENLKSQFPLDFAFDRIFVDEAQDWQLDEAEILTVAVSKDVQRGGIGFALIDEALRRLHAMRIAALFLEVEEGNQPALGLYRKMGFKKVGQRDNYYGKTEAVAGETPKAALVMRRDLR